MEDFSWQRPRWLRRPLPAALFISGVYLAVGVMWILVSDDALDAMTLDAALLSRLQTWKGWFFVACTAALLFALLGWLLRGWRAESRAYEAMERRHQEDLERLVVERTAQLAAKNKELEDFSHSVSHDLKAPLRGIDGYGRLLEEEYGGVLDAEGRRFVATIRRAAAQMNQLIEDLLSYSRLERRATHVSSFDLRALAQEEAAACGEQGQDHARIELDVPDISLNTDAESLRMALRNLLDNALKFTRGVASPQVRVSALRDGAFCRVSVSDNGPGFDMKFHDRIFDIFQRLHRAEDYPGTGIGLAIVRKAAERLAGRAWAESREGEGAVFHLQFPITLP